MVLVAVIVVVEWMFRGGKGGGKGFGIRVHGALSIAYH